MNNETLKEHFRSLGWRVEDLSGQDNKRYIVIRGYLIGTGSLSGRTCDVAIECVDAVPYIAPAAIHTRPALVPMGNHCTQASGIGAEWQYWSRRLRGQPTPQKFVAQIATIFSEV